MQAAVQHTASELMYTWTFPGAPITIRIAIDVVSRIEQELAATPADEAFCGILLGRYDRRGAVEILDHKPLGPWSKRSAAMETVCPRPEQAHAVIGEFSPVGYYRTTSDHVIQLQDDDVVFIQERFADPHNVFLQIDKPANGNGYLNAGFFFSDGGRVHSAFSFLEFPFNVDELRLRATEQQSAMSPRTRTADPEVDTPSVEHATPLETVAAPRESVEKSRPPAGFDRKEAKRKATRYIGIAFLATTVLAAVVSLWFSAPHLRWAVPAKTRIASKSDSPKAENHPSSKQSAPIHNATAEAPLPSKPAKSQAQAINKPAPTPAANASTTVPAKPSTPLFAEDTSSSKVKQTSKTLPIAASTVKKGELRIAPAVPSKNQSSDTAARPKRNPPARSDRAPQSVSAPLPPPAPPASTQSDSTAIRRDRVEQPQFVPAKPLQRVNPIIPAELRQSISGVVSVRVRVRIDPNGTVMDVQPVSPDPAKAIFTNFAMAAAKNWTFEPARYGERAVTSEAVLEFRFVPDAR